MSVITAPSPVETEREVTTSDVLHRAADSIEEFGWDQGTISFHWAGRGPKCLLGSIFRAALDLGFVWRGYDQGDGCRYEYAASFLGNKDMYPIYYGWNDDPNTTKEQVVGFLRKRANDA